jgi:putative FmdB family regulatory protein
MPIYAYRCGRCRLRGERYIQSGQEVRCERCGRVAERLVSTCAVRYHGSGFYCTDYAHLDDRAWPRMTVYDRQAWNRGRVQKKKEIPFT